MNVYSAATGQEYLNEDAYVAAEANGYVVVALLQDVGGQSRVAVFGPHDTRAEATRLAGRVRYRVKQTGGVTLLSARVTPLHPNVSREDY